MSLGYGYVLNGASCEAFNLLPRRSRDQLLGLFRRPAAQPFTTGDYQEMDQRGLRPEVMLVESEFLVTWHTDHAAKEICVVALETV